MYSICIIALRKSLHLKYIKNTLSSFSSWNLLKGLVRCVVNSSESLYTQWLVINIVHIHFYFSSPVEQDWNELIPETQRLDSTAQKAKCRLAQKSKRQAPSRNKLKANLDSPHPQVCAE